MWLMMAVEAAPLAAPAAAEGVIVYEPAFFAAANPITALDMVVRVPGFALQDVGDARGFGGVSGNVLIDGERPSTKSESLGQILARIPASGVARIELIRGAGAGLDVGGQSVIVNVIRNRDKPFEAIAELETRIFDDGIVRPNAEIQGAYRFDRTTIDGRFSIFTQTQTFDSVEPSIAVPSGAILQIEEQTTRDPFREFDLVVGLQRRFDDGGVFNIRFTGNRGRFMEIGDFRLFDAAGALFEEQDSLFADRFMSGELSADYERPLGSGTLKIIALQNLDRSDSSSQFIEEVGTPDSELSIFEDLSLSGESVLRVTLTAKPTAKLTTESGAEGAYNFLDSATALAIDDGDGLVEIDLPSSDVRVAEGRGEGFATATWVLSPRWTLEGGFRLELSTIRQSGDAALNRFFVFPKPRVLATWSPLPKRQFRLRAERVVGQLDFGDFVSSSDLQNDLIDAGNPDLEPQRQWEFEVEAEQRWSEQGSVILSLRYDRLSQVQDLIPILGQFDAPGNIGDGRRLRLNLQLFLPLDAIGLDGAVIDSELSWRTSRVTDPVTGEGRRIAFEAPFRTEAEFRWDLDSISSTFSAEVRWNSENQSFRLFETQARRNTPNVEASFEYKGIKNTAITIFASNLTNRRNERDRFLFDGPRDVGAIDQIDARVSQFGRVFGFSWQRTF